MARLLLRVGGLLIVAAVLYTAGWELFSAGPDKALVRTLLAAGALCMSGGLVLRIAGRTAAGIAGRSCPRCGRRVARGRVYCDEHLQETINEYRDRQRDGK